MGKFFLHDESVYQAPHPQQIGNKSSNILLDKRDNAYLTDFGIAKMLVSKTRLTMTDHILGTPAYMSPEQWRSDTVDGRADIYALGIIAYEMLTGNLPYVADTPFTLMYQHVNEPPPSISHVEGISDAIEYVLLRALEKDPDARFSTADEFAKAFDDAIRGVTPVIHVGEISSPETRVDLEFKPSSLKTTTPDIDRQTDAVPATLVTQQRQSLPLVIGGLIIGLLIAILVIFVAVEANEHGGLSGLFSSSPSETPELPTVTPISNVIVFAQHDGVALHEAPSFDAQVVDRLDQGDSLFAFGTNVDRDWIQVETSNDQLLWIARNAARIEGSVDSLQVIQLPGGFAPNQPSNNNTGAEIAHIMVSEIGIEFDLPRAWTYTIDGNVISFTPQPASGIRDSGIEIARLDVEQIERRYGVAYSADENLEFFAEDIVVNVLDRLRPDSLEQIVFPAIDFNFPTAIFTTEARPQRYYVAVIGLTNEDFVLIWLDLPIPINDEPIRANVLVPLILSLQVDRQFIAIPLDINAPQDTVPPNDRRNSAPSRGTNNTTTQQTSIIDLQRRVFGG